MKRHVLLILFGLPLAVLTQPVAAQGNGFTPADLAQAAQVPEAEANQLAGARQVAARTEILRAILATGMADASRRIGSDELRVITTALGAPTTTRDVAVSWLMRAGVTTAADANISGIYNPLADAWLALRWAHIGGSPRLIDAALVRGTSLRPDDEHDWQASAAPFATALVQTKLQAVASFALLPAALGAPRLFAMLGAMRDIERAAVFTRTDMMLGAISAWSRSNGPTLAGIDRAVRNNADTQLLALPRRVRDALTPMAVITSPQGEQLVLLSAVYPSRVVTARLSGAGVAPLFESIDLAPEPTRGAAR